MRHVTFRHAAIAALAFGLGTAGGHAAEPSGAAGGLQRIDTTSLASSQTTMLAVQGTSVGASPTAVPAARDLVVQAHAAVLRPAPVPDQDFDAPGPSRQALAEQDQASLQPSFYSAARRGFSGDGFANGSTLDDDHANRRKPGGGVSLSIPVQ